MIQVFDAYGRPMLITKEEWRTKVLPSTIQSCWNDPDQLHSVIANSLRDGLPVDVLKAAEHLHEIERASTRSTCIYGITLMELHRHPEAERLFLDHFQTNGEDGLILTNLAKIYGVRGDTKKAEVTLWHALELDPNQENGLLFYLALHRERDGENGRHQALQRVSQLPNSWRAQLWIARDALDNKDLAAALRSYDIIFESLTPPPADVLMQISGDLGRRGYLKEIFEVCGPRFQPQLHGLLVGNNLIKAHVDHGDPASARKIVESLYQQNRPDWKETLQYWESEIDKLDHKYGPMSKSEKISVNLLTIDGPIWAQEGDPSLQLLANKPEDAVRVAFMCGSADLPSENEGDRRIQKQRTNPEGRTSRGLPAYLAERVHLQTTARSTLLVPRMKQGGFILLGAPWNPDAIGTLDPKPDYLVLLHLDAHEVPWNARFSMIRMIDESELWSSEGRIHPDSPGADFEKIVNELMVRIKPLIDENHPGAEAIAPPSNGAALASYVAGLEQALTVFCAAQIPGDERSLYGDRSIIDELLNRAIEDRVSIPMRMLLFTTLENASKFRPDIIPEFRERLLKLHREHPLPQPAQGLAEGVLHKIFPDSAR